MTEHEAIQHIGFDAILKGKDGVWTLIAILPFPLDPYFLFCFQAKTSSSTISVKESDIVSWTSRGQGMPEPEVRALPGSNGVRLLTRGDISNAGQSIMIEAQPKAGAVSDGGAGSPILSLTDIDKGFLNCDDVEAVSIYIVISGYTFAIGAPRGMTYRDFSQKVAKGLISLFNELGEPLPLVPNEGVLERKMRNGTVEVYGGGKHGE